jgi:hypothetical protein
MGGSIDPAGEGLIRLACDPDTYRGLPRDEAEKLVERAKNGLSKEQRRIVEKIVKRGRG